MSSADETFIIYNLDDCTDYELQFRSVCAFDTTSFSESIPFSTNCLTTVLNHPTRDIKVYPNPFKGHPFISLDEGITGDISMRIISMNGDMLVAGKLSGPSHAPFPLTDLADLPDGVYFLVLWNSQFTKTVKLLKIH